MVDPLAMLGLPALLLAALGALRGPRELRVLGLGWTLMLLPLVLLDLTGVRYVPQRSVAYLAPGLALLGGAGAAWLLPRARALARRSPSRRAALVAAGMAGLLVLAGTGASAKGWYRIYPERDQVAFQDTAAYAEEHHLRVVAGSWQAMAQLGAWGADVLGEPKFFQNASFRASYAQRTMLGQPFVVVLDKEARLRADASSAEYENYSLGFVQDLLPLPFTGKYAAAYLDVPGAPAANATAPVALSRR
jgi:hypothetical protein